MLKPIPSENRIIKPFKVYRTVILDGPFDSASKVANWSNELTESIVRSGGQYASLYAQFYGSQSYYAYGNDNQWKPGESVYVINIPQHEYGEGIRPHTFVVSSPFQMIASNSLASVGELKYVDDGNTGIIEQITGNRVGNVFYGLGVAFINQLTVITSSVQALVISSSSSYTTITSGSQHLDRYGVYHFDAQINGAHQFGAVFGWYTGSSIGSGSLSYPADSASANPIVHAQLFHSNSLLELQVKLIGTPMTQSYDIIFSRLV